MKDDRFAADLIADLREYNESLLDAGVYRDPVMRAIYFLDNRLTDAAKDGCHHCDEGEPGEPCKWCGLKVGA